MAINTLPEHYIASVIKAYASDSYIALYIIVISSYIHFCSVVRMSMYSCLCGCEYLHIALKVICTQAMITAWLNKLNCSPML